ncbi:MAG TPA: hypothetical protein VHT30_03430 [Acidimicrobiales bacterium]|nr:hypothetical protein [Acidimicrobiales bacterium]
MPEQYRLQFAVRGGEYAFAICQDDFDALEEVAGYCCDVWNGANSLICAVDGPDALPNLEYLLAARNVEVVYVHKRVDEATRAALIARFNGRVEHLWGEQFRHEVHPILLQPSYRDRPAGGPHLELPIPVYDDELLRRLSRVVYGRIEDDDRPEYAKAFTLTEYAGAQAHFALVDAQISGLSPLGQSTALMPMYQQSGPIRMRQLVVLDGSDFDALIYFWNLRARATTLGVEPPVVAIPAQGLQTPVELRSLRAWTDAPGRTIKPDIFVLADVNHRKPVSNALLDLGYHRAADDAALTEYFGTLPEGAEVPEYKFTSAGWIGGPFRRGVWHEQLVMLNAGRNIVRFEPKGFAISGFGGKMRLDLLSWPLPLKATSATAARVHKAAVVDQGVVCLLTRATNDALVFDLTVPGADDVLTDFLAELGLTGKLSAAGRYAVALIGRLGGPQRLDALASRAALDILKPLTPLSRIKVVQQLGRKLKELFGDDVPAQEELAEIIRGQVLALDLPAPSLDDLRSLTGTAKAELLHVLEPLIDTGFVRRGRSERCPECGYADFYPLGELDERVRCHACQQGFLVRVATGPDEPRLAYQLDPLMARALDQDLMPVFLTLRHLYSAEGPGAAAFWPGIEISEIERVEETKQDCDILLAQGGNVTVCECKLSAPGLSVAQAQATLSLAGRLGARTIFAALEGTFSEDVRSLGEPPDLQLLTRSQLVPPDA